MATKIIKMNNYSELTLICFKCPTRASSRLLSLKLYTQCITKPAIITILHPGHHQACYHCDFTSRASPSLLFYSFTSRASPSLLSISITFYLPWNSQKVTKSLLFHKFEMLCYTWVESFKKKKTSVLSACIHFGCFFFFVNFHFKFHEQMPWARQKRKNGLIDLSMSCYPWLESLEIKMFLVSAFILDAFLLLK